MFPLVSIQIDQPDRFSDRINHAGGHSFRSACDGNHAAVVGRVHLRIEESHTGMARQGGSKLIHYFFPPAFTEVGHALDYLVQAFSNRLMMMFPLLMVTAA
jgi:hypothetical protein